jgi:hypothetical protein
VRIFLANNLENRINKSAAILEITGELPQVKNTSYASSISSELHGIPKDLDIAKRKIAHDILASDKDLQVIFFLMPNGDMYMDGGGGQSNPSSTHRWNPFKRR